MEEDLMFKYRIAKQKRDTHKTADDYAIINMIEKEMYKEIHSELREERKNNN